MHLSRGEKLTVTSFRKLSFNKYLLNTYYLPDCSRSYNSEETKPQESYMLKLTDNNKTPEFKLQYDKWQKVKWEKGYGVLVVVIFNRFFFQSSFRLTEKLRRQYREFPKHLPMHTASPVINIPYYNGTFVMTEKPILIHYY